MTAIPAQSSSDRRIITSAAAGHGRRVLTPARDGSGWTNPAWALSTFLAATTRHPHANERSQYRFNSRLAGDGKGQVGISSVGELCDAVPSKHATVEKVATCAA